MELNTNSINQINLDNDEISIKDLFIKTREWLRYLISKWLIILLFGIVGGLIGLTVAILDKPTYKAVLTFAMEDEKGAGSGGIGGAIGLASSFGIDLGNSFGGGAFAAGNLSELMKSRLIVEKALLSPLKTDYSLVDYYIEVNKLRESWKKNPKIKNITFSPSSDRNKFTLIQDSILMQIYYELINEKKLRIFQKDKKVSILSIEVISNNELFSKIFCENLARETSNFYIETKSRKSKINVDVLQKQVDSIRVQINNAIFGVAKEADNLYNLNPAFNIKASVSKKKQIDVQSNTTIFSNLLVQLELAKINLRKETPLIQLIDRPIFPLEKQKLGKLKSIIFGTLFSSILIILFLILRKVFNNISN